MRVVRLQISNFRAIRCATVYPERHNALLGPNNMGKTAILEALHLLLSPELTGRTTAIDENDFFARKYRSVGEADAPIIQIRAVITGLSADDEDAFRDVLVPWNEPTRTVVERSDEGTDAFDGSAVAIEPTFEAWYDDGEDDFQWRTFFRTDPLRPREECPRFTREQKRRIGFLIYRDFRALHRPVTLEHAALFDRVLRAGGASARNFDEILTQLAGSAKPLFDDPTFAAAIKNYRAELARYLPVGSAGDAELTFDVTDRTRTQARAAMQLYVADALPLPLQKMGAGTRSLAILAMLLVIARQRGYGIIALEEPETFLFPHAQRRVMTETLALATQTFVTTHSPTVLEVLPMDALHRVCRDAPTGSVTVTRVAEGAADIKNMRKRMRKQLAEALLGRAAIVVEEESMRLWLQHASAALHGTSVDGAVCEAFDLAGIGLVAAEGNGEVPEIVALLERAGVPALGFLDRVDEKALAALQAKHPAGVFIFHPAAGLEDLLVAAMPRPLLRETLVSAPYVRLNIDPNSLDGLDDSAFREKALEFLKRNKGSLPFHEWLLERIEPAHIPVVLQRIVALVTTLPDTAPAVGSCSVLGS
jgi:putative ATP-dependent endonuclease of OLD family